MKSENHLDQLLEDSGEVDSPNADVLLAARKVVTAEATTTAARVAKIVRMRRHHRRLTIGVAAAAVAGLVAIPLLSQGGNTSTPPTATPPVTHVAPPVQVHYKTVAQVIDAAAAASGSANPADAPYWKVVTSWDCGQSEPCESTQWNGNGRPGASANFDGTGYMKIPAATVTVDGRTMGWKQANNHVWTQTQVASMVADSSPAAMVSTAAANGYMFKNAIGLLTYMPASPAIRQQLWRVLGTAQGAVLKGQVEDSLGRTGWKILLHTPGQGTQWLVVDTTTGAVLEDGGAGPTPGVAGWVETIVSAGPADSAPATLTPAQSRRRLLAIYRGCGVTSQMERRMAHIAHLTGRMPQYPKRIGECLDAALN